MAINKKSAPIKETVGDCYYVFATLDPEDATKFTKTYEADVTCVSNLKNVKVTENGDNVPVYASGKLYTNVNSVSSIDNELEVIYFPAADVAKMLGNNVGTNGLIMGGAPNNRPYFAFGKTVLMRNGGYRYVWYPKCQLLSRTDDAKTKEESFSEQTDTYVIKAIPFDDAGNVYTEFDSTVKPDSSVTEDKFFSKPILSDDELKTAIGV